MSASQGGVEPRVAVGSIPPVALSAPETTLVLGARAIRDLELVLLGVLPAGIVIGAALDLTTEATLTGVPVGPETAGAEQLLLVDEEQTPLATLTVEVRDEAVARGTLTARRRRESGAGRDRALQPDDLRRPWPAVLVLARPALTSDPLDIPSGALLLVPDDISGTDGVPVTTVLALADDLAERLGATVRCAPVSWRDPASDAVLVDALGAALAPAAGAMLVLRESDGSRGAADWADLRAQLDGPGLDPASGAELLPTTAVRRLEAWRPPRSRRGVVVMFTGLSGSGKSTVARALAARITEETDRTVSLLDGDVVRQLLSSGLGFDRESRLLNLRRIGWVAAEIARHGGIAICAPIAPYAGIRAEVRAMAEQVGDFVLVHVSTPLEECERRDLKGLYAKARAGLIPEFTGISDPYDVPTDADVVVDTSALPVASATTLVFDQLVSGGWISGPASTDASPNEQEHR